MPKSSAPPGLLLIRGLGHSGSTILDLALGAHSSIVGLGKRFACSKSRGWVNPIRARSSYGGALRCERRCTCGATAGMCPVCGPVLTWLPEHDDRPLLEKVDRLIAPLTSGSARWLVESFQADEQLLDARALGRPSG